MLQDEWKLFGRWDFRLDGPFSGRVQKSRFLFFDQHFFETLEPFFMLP